jgi:hypothetical protein
MIICTIINILDLPIPEFFVLGSAAVESGAAADQPSTSWAIQIGIIVFDAVMQTGKHWWNPLCLSVSNNDI